MPGSDPVSYLGKVRDFMAVYPKLKASANLQWSLDRWSASVGTNGLSGVENTGSTVKRRLGAYISTELSLGYQFDRVGITRSG
ncbi:hypothetical protein [Steroidobacter sp.]|uniref:hypothetical protein n=1 Tax=Steroidobacter sp. TaxID=1978227 RepID=UPI001A48584F|nr:hypothetical protein [Steroidobacter sp.]MBL8272076.1 hypothetical protein [Steroidobacter sp.]